MCGEKASGKKVLPTFRQRTLIRIETGSRPWHTLCAPLVAHPRPCLALAATLLLLLLLLLSVPPSICFVIYVESAALVTLLAPAARQAIFHTHTGRERDRERERERQRGSLCGQVV